MILSGFATFAPKIFKPNFASEFINKVVSTAFDAETAFSKVTYQMPAWEANKTVVDEEHEKYMIGILKNWDNSRPLIEPYSFIKLPPPKTAEDLGPYFDQ